MKKTLLQSLLFAGLCCLFSFANLFINPSALSLSTNYSPSSSSVALEHEFGEIEYTELQSYLELLNDDPPYVVVIDARNEAAYELGHIPGAYLVDHYRQQQYLDQLAPLISQTPIVVVYCKGGDCEDSIFLARDLAYKYDVAVESLFIYEGGTNDWQANGLELKTGIER
ncbi:MAG: rhodanese-like domain-containing protein [Planctomycetota bacterium]|nr:rhodanese-like domain-containing protein [Planctomycetota bacterium]